MDGFSKFHPLVCFIYFASVIIFAMTFMQPILSLISLIGSCIYFVRLKSLSSLLHRFKFLLPISVIAIIFNALFNNQGLTILISIFNINITLESLLYGLTAALNLITVITWFSCFNLCLDFNKIMFLFSSLSPMIALLFTTSVKLSGDLNQKYRDIVNSKALIYGPSKDTSFKANLIDFYENILILASWSFENSIFTAISMRSRGFELKNKTYYSEYTFCLKDTILLTIIMMLVSAITTVIIIGSANFQFYPQLASPDTNNYTYILYLSYALFCMLPIISSRPEVIRWTRLSKLKT